MKFLWIFDADAVLVLSPLCGVLWALGGAGIKPIRRIGIPFLISLSMLSLGAPLFLALCQFLALFAVTTLPYGESLEKRVKGFYYSILFIIGASYGASLFPLVLHFHHLLAYGVGIISIASLFVVTFFLSRLGFLPWKLAEILTGMSIGCVATILMR